MSIIFIPLLKPVLAVLQTTLRCNKLVAVKAEWGFTGGTNLLLFCKQAVETFRCRPFTASVQDFLKHKPLNKIDKVDISFLIAAVMLLSVQEMTNRKQETGNRKVIAWEQGQINTCIRDLVAVLPGHGRSTPCLLLVGFRDRSLSFSDNFHHPSCFLAQETNPAQWSRASANNRNNSRAR